MRRARAQRRFLDGELEVGRAGPTVRLKADTTANRRCDGGAMVRRSIGVALRARSHVFAWHRRTAHGRTAHLALSHPHRRTYRTAALSHLGRVHPEQFPGSRDVLLRCAKVTDGEPQHERAIEPCVRQENFSGSVDGIEQALVERVEFGIC